MERIKARGAELLISSDLTTTERGHPLELLQTRISLYKIREGIYLYTIQEVLPHPLQHEKWALSAEDPQRGLTFQILNTRAAIAHYAECDQGTDEDYEAFTARLKEVFPSGEVEEYLATCY